VTIEFEIFLSGTLCHFCTHASARVTNLEKNECFIIDHPYRKIPQQIFSRDSPIVKEFGSHLPKVTLYSNANFNELFQAYIAQYNNPNEFTFVCNNCGDAVNFILQKAFPENKKEDRISALYRALCCSLWMGAPIVFCLAYPTVSTCTVVAETALSLANCTTCSPKFCCTTPTDLFFRAKLYKKREESSAKNMTITTAITPLLFPTVPVVAPTISEEKLAQPPPPIPSHSRISQ
jgi:hypothetical protein